MPITCGSPNAAPKPKKEESKVATKPKAAKKDDSDSEMKDDDDALLMPGQRYAAPDEGEGTRVFYETMYEQMPGSRFAEKWLLDHGCLPQEKAAKLAQYYKKKK